MPAKTAPQLFCPAPATPIHMCTARMVYLQEEIEDVRHTLARLDAFQRQLLNLTEASKRSDAHQLLRRAAYCAQRTDNFSRSIAWTR